MYLAKAQRTRRGKPRQRGKLGINRNSWLTHPALGSNHAPVFAFRFPPCLCASVRVGVIFFSHRGTEAQRESCHGLSDTEFDRKIACVSQRRKDRKGEQPLDEREPNLEIEVTVNVFGSWF